MPTHSSPHCLGPLAGDSELFQQATAAVVDQSDAPSSSNVPRRLPGPVPAAEPDFAQAVDLYYVSLYRFGFRLSRSQSDAADLTQETYRILYTKGADIRDPGKVKSWLFMTLYRLFLRGRRRAIRFPQDSIEGAEWDPPATGPENGEQIDGSLAVEALQRLDDVFRVPLTMFYLEDLSYKEMATVLGVPVGTIMSRLFRGKEILRRQLSASVLVA